MKVLFKIGNNVQTISNVSVDNKCFPLVGGIHPFSVSSKSKSPLAIESSLWFKTLAVDTIYIDCNACFIFWTAIKNDHISEEVKLRRQKTTFVPYQSDFVPENAKPLVSDLSLFDFDPSYKEMIVKSLEVAKKLTSKTISVNDTNSIVANLLHVYILPSIKFTSDEHYALSRARCLIEERHLQADADISNKAKAINLLQLSLDNLKDNLLIKDNFESENFLRTCNIQFLNAFLKKIEDDSLKLNLDLEAQQSKVNWAKEQKYEKEEIAKCQERRNGLFEDVQRLIKVREALKNVVTRKAKVKVKKGKQQIIDSCFHNVFIEILRRLELENTILEQLVEDKLNISAAREATLSVVMKFDENSRISSDRSTRFEPSSFGDYHLDVNAQVEKSDAWLTLQERVSKVLKVPSSIVASLHSSGCKSINLQIDLALSEFHLHGMNNQKKYDVDLEFVPEIELSYDQTPPVDMRNHDTMIFEFENSDDKTPNQSSLLDMPVSKVDRRSGNVFPKETTADGFTDINEHPTEVKLKEKNGAAEKPGCASLDYVVKDDDSDWTDPLKAPVTQESQNFFISENVAINMLMASVENIKATVNEHFRDVVRCLQNHLTPDSDSMEPFEILWKAYERQFSREVLHNLTTLYNTMLETGSKDVYVEIRKTSLQDLLEDDKILDLFFKPGARHLSGISFGHKSLVLDTISMAKTLSVMSLDVRQYSIDELYNLANADSNDLCQRFKLDIDEHSDEGAVGSPSSSGSGASVKTSDLFDDVDDEDKGISHSSGSLSNSPKAEQVITSESNTLESHQNFSFATSEEHSRYAHQDGFESKVDAQDASSDSLSESGLFVTPHEIIDVMEPVLSPFRNQIVKCMKADSIVDKVRYLSKAVISLNDDISHLYGDDHMSACDDIISMLVLSLANMPEDVFIALYSNLRLLIDILPSFFSGSLCDFNLVSLVAAYDYLLNRNVCQRVVKRYASSFKVSRPQS